MQVKLEALQTQVDRDQELINALQCQLESMKKQGRVASGDENRGSFTADLLREVTQLETDLRKEQDARCISLQVNRTLL